MISLPEKKFWQWAWSIIGVARGRHGRAFALLSLNCALPSKCSSYLNFIELFFYNLLRLIVPARNLPMKCDLLDACHAI